MKIPSLIIAILAGLHSTTASSPAETAPELAKPYSVVFILADDLGYGELGCYGQEKIQTPNIDRLAGEGIRFTQHYTGAPVCAPARCTLLTGQHLGRAEIRTNKDSGNGRVFPGQWPLSSEIMTIAKVLKNNGYATGAFGKWGLGPSNTTGSPIKQGFDRYFGYNCQRNAHSFYPLFLDSDEREIKVNDGLIPGHLKKPEGEIIADDYRLENYAPDLILAEALKFLDDHVAKSKKPKNRGTDQPFFLYLPFIEPHLAMQPPQEWIDRYPAEWDMEKGPYRGQNGYLPHPRPRAGYAAMISDLDEHVGTILDRLDHHDLTENTVVIFTSDNGTTHPRNDPTFYVGGADPLFFNSTAGLKGYKGSVDEGGIRVPCVVRWPRQITPGSTTEMPSYFPDWFPTLCAITHTPLPENQTLNGLDLTPALKGKSTPDRPDPMVWEFHGYGGLLAIRDGQWKAVRRNILKKQPGAWELYDIENDPNETMNVAADHPKIVTELEDAYLSSRTPNPIFPLPLYDEKE